MSHTSITLYGTSWCADCKRAKQFLGEQRELHPSGVFVFIGLTLNTAIVKDLVRLDGRGFIVTDMGMQTSLPGVFAAGDCRAGSTKQATSAGEGAAAALAIRRYVEPLASGIPARVMPVELEKPRWSYDDGCMTGDDMIAAPTTRAIDAGMLVGYSPLANRTNDVMRPRRPAPMSDSRREEPTDAPPDAPSSLSSPPASVEDLALVTALRQGDERAFLRVVERYHMALIHLALAYVSSRAVAEEVAQDTWLAVLQGIGRFEGRSSLKTWIFRILTNKAKTRGEREGRVVPFSALAAREDDADEPAVPPEHFRASGEEWAGGWRTPPPRWDAIPEEHLLGRETREMVASAIAALPPNQRTVITLRDVEGWTAEEVRDLLQISDANQRVLLHRARAKVRAALERYLTGTEGQPA